ncbi:hypothetical protein ACLKA7_003722 [Drosophila subpalustris]
MQQQRRPQQQRLLLATPQDAPSEPRPHRPADHINFPHRPPRGRAPVAQMPIWPVVQLLFLLLLLQLPATCPTHSRGVRLLADGALICLAQHAIKCKWATPHHQQQQREA